MIENVLKKDLILLFYLPLIPVLVVISLNVSLKDATEVKSELHGLGSNQKVSLLGVIMKIPLLVSHILCLNVIIMLKIQNILIVLILNKFLLNVIKNALVMELTIEKTK